jgi:hypothetical protein
MTKMGGSSIVTVLMNLIEPVALTHCESSFETVKY